MKPFVFIGSSVEGEPYANAIYSHLERVAQPDNWRSIFELSHHSMGDLQDSLNKYEYAVFVLSPDDVVESLHRNQGQKRVTARDNLFLEMGLFIGRIGMSRVFYVKPESVTDFKLPTDLNGVTYGTYNDKRSDNNRHAATLTFASRVVSRIQEDQRTNGPRPFSIANSVLMGRWEADYNGGPEHFTIDEFGRYYTGHDPMKLYENLLYVLSIIKETRSYVEFARIPIHKNYVDANVSRYAVISPNMLRGTEDNGTITTYYRKGFPRQEA